MSLLGSCGGGEWFWLFVLVVKCIVFGMLGEEVEDIVLFGVYGCW